MNRRFLGFAAGAAVMLLALAAALRAVEAPVAEAPKPPAEPATAEELKHRLTDLAVKGKLTAKVIDLFKAYALARAKQDLGKEVPEDFWAWLAANPVICDGLLVALHPDYKADIVKRLQELRTAFGAKVDAHPHLALAFAVVFGKSGEKPPWGTWGGDTLKGDRQGPTMVESFDYYLKHEGEMKGSLKRTPWCLLAYIADNETPISERLWVLKFYGGYDDAKFLGVYHELQDNWLPQRMKGKPNSLENLKRFGSGVTDRAYFSSRIYKSLGIPALYDWCGLAAGTHSWLAWVAPKANAFQYFEKGRSDCDECYAGSVYCPLAQKEILDRSVQMLAASVSASYDEYLHARIGCHVYALLEEGDRNAGVQLLKDALDRNHFCSEAWRSLADACEREVVPAEEGEALFGSALSLLKSYPDFTYEILMKVLSPRLKEKENRDSKEIDGNLAVLARALAFYDQAKRPDLAVELCLLQSRYLETVGRPMDGLKLCVTTSEKYAKDTYCFRKTFDRALEMFEKANETKKLLAFCEMMVNAVPRQRKLDRYNKELNPSYKHVARAYIRALHAAGNENLAKRWEKNIEEPGG